MPWNVLKFMKIFISAFLGICLLLFIISRFNYVSLGSPKQRPEWIQISGHYSIDQSTKDFLISKGYILIDTYIDLHPSGELTMVNIPDLWWAAFNQEEHEYASGDGLWKLHENGAGLWEIRCQWTGGELVEDGKGGGNFHITGSRPPYKIWLSVYSPDYGKMVFVKRTEEDDMGN